MTATADSPIKITVQRAAQGKQRITILMDPSKFEAVRQFAMLNHINQGEVMEKAIELMFQVMAEMDHLKTADQTRPGFFERLANDPRWLTRKR